MRHPRGQVRINDLNGFNLLVLRGELTGSEKSCNGQGLVEIK